MTIELVGYARLIEKYKLACNQTTSKAVIDTSIKVEQNLKEF